MAESSVVRNKRDGIITASAGAYTYVWAYEPGDLKIDGGRYTVSHYLDRGELTAVPSIRKGDDQPITLTWSCYLRDIADLTATETYTTPLDLSYRFASGYAETNWTSTLSGYSDVETVTLDWTVDGSMVGESDKTMSFPYCFLAPPSVAEGDPTTITHTATSYVTRPTVS